MGNGARHQRLDEMIRELDKLMIEDSMPLPRTRTSGHFKNALTLLFAPSPRARSTDSG